VSAGPEAMPVTPQGEIIPPTDDTAHQLDCVICHGKTYNGGGKYSYEGSHLNY